MIVVLSKSDHLVNVGLDLQNSSPEDVSNLNFLETYRNVLETHILKIPF